MKSLTQFITENLSNAEYEKFMEAVDKHFSILRKELDKKEFIKTLETYSNRVSLKDEWEDFVDSVLANTKYLGYNLSYVKIMKDSSLLEAVASNALEWLDTWTQPD